MTLFKRWVRAYRDLRSLARPNDFVKIFEVKDGQVLIEMDYPQMPDEPYGLIQKTVISKTIKGKVTSDFGTEAAMRNAFNTFTQEMAQTFNEQIQKII